MKPVVTGSLELIKKINTSCILEALRENSLISRADIARNTGLTPATVSNIISELMELNLIVEIERGESSGGRRPVMLAINQKACYFIGAHISSVKLEVAVVDVGANIVWHEKQMLPHAISQSDALDRLLHLISQAREQWSSSKIVGIGVCCDGLVASKEGLLVFSPNLGWENVRIGELLSNRFRLPVFVENDVQAMTLSESWCGIAQNVKDYVYLYIGPGIGGSVVINGELFKGGSGFAGEFGHNTIVPDGPLCPCGNSGCLQALASEQTMLRNFIEKKNDTKYASYTFAAMLRDARAGDTIALMEIQKSARYIGIAVDNIIKAFSPTLLIINGTITSLGKPIMTVIDGEVRRRSLGQIQNRTRIVFSTLGDNAQIKGAGACAIREMFASPKKFLHEEL